MVGTDRSETAERAVRWAATFAEAFGAELHVVQVVLDAEPRSDRSTEQRRRPALPAQPTTCSTYARQVAGDRGRAHVVIHDDPAMAIVEAAEEHAIDVLVVGQRRHGGPQGVPAGQRAQPHQPQRSVHGDHREHGGARRQRRPLKPRPAAPAPRSVRARPTRSRSSHASWRAAVTSPRCSPSTGSKELFGRPDEDGAVGRQTPGQAVAQRPSKSSGPRSPSSGQVLSTRPDLLPPEFIEELATLQDHVQPACRSRQVVQVMERELGVPWEDVFETIDPAAAGRRHDRRGAPGHARHRRPGRREGAAAQRARGDRAGSGVAGAVRREGQRPSRPEPGDRHGRGVRAPVVVAASRAGLPAGSRQHRADARRDRGLPAPGGSRRLRRPVQLTPAGDGGDPGRPPSRRLPTEQPARRPPASCWRATTSRSWSTGSSTPIRTRAT